MTRLVLTTKRLSLLKHLLPNLRRVAILWNRDDQAMMLRYETSAKAAEALGITVQTVAVQERDDFNSVLATMDREPPEAIIRSPNLLKIFQPEACVRLHFGQANTGDL